MELSCYSSSIAFKELVIEIYNSGYIHWDCPNSNILSLNLNSEYIVDALLRKDVFILDALQYLTKRRSDLKIITIFNEPSSHFIDVIPHWMDACKEELNEKIEFTLNCDLSTDKQKICALEVKQYLKPIILKIQNKKIRSLAIQQRRQEFQLIKPQLLLFLIERDGHKCNFCDSIENIQVDHIVALSKGGTDEPINLQLLCRSCNSKKRDK